MELNVVGITLSEIRIRIWSRDVFWLAPLDPSINGAKSKVHLKNPRVCASLMHSVRDLPGLDLTHFRYRSRCSGCCSNGVCLRRHALAKGEVSTSGKLVHRPRCSACCSNGVWLRRQASDGGGYVSTTRLAFVPTRSSTNSTSSASLRRCT